MKRGLKRGLWAALLAGLPLLAQAQIALFSWDGAVEKPVSSVFDVGRVAVDDTKDVLFRIRNQSASGGSVTTLFVNGAGFSTPDSPSVPFSVGAGAFVQFIVRFAAGGALSYSANLQVNGISVILLAASVPAATVAMVAGCTGADPVDFGRIARGSTVSCTFAVSNPN